MCAEIYCSSIKSEILTYGKDSAEKHCVYDEDLFGGNMRVGRMLWMSLASLEMII